MGSARAAHKDYQVLQAEGSRLTSDLAEFIKFNLESYTL